jgi:hypothetical protein
MTSGDPTSDPTSLLSIVPGVSVAAFAAAPPRNNAATAKNTALNSALIFIREPSSQLQANGRTIAPEKSSMAI